MEEKIRNRIKELTERRDEIVKDANQAIASLNTAIAELEALLKPDEPEKGEEDAKDGSDTD